MKVVAIAVVFGALAVAGAKELLSARDSSGKKCWSPGEIQDERFSLRGVPGSIRSFDVKAVEGCEFNVKIEIDSPTGTRSLDYNATYASGDRPIFIRYNTPP